MIAFRYTKSDGAEFLSHLDLLRHIYRTMRRAGIPVAMSEGYHAHARIYLNNPLPVGIASVAEYGCVDTDFDGDFKSLFNGFAPKGVTCVDYKKVDINPNYAASIEKCTYTAEGITPFDVQEILGEEHIIINDTRGREIDIRERLYDLETDGDAVKFTCGCNEKNLRPDLFASYLGERFGGTVRRIVKIASYGKGVF